MDTLWILVWIAVILVAADFVGGLFHWAEDTLGDVDTPIWGHFVRPNVLHHAQPTATLTRYWLWTNLDAFGAAAVLMAAVWMFGALTWQAVLFLCLAAFNQQAYRFVHCPTSQLPAPVKWIQRAGILQTAPQHWKHHRPPHLTSYCVLTPWLNPILDGTSFWRMLERAVVPVLASAPRRPDLVRAAQDRPH